MNRIFASKAVNAGRQSEFDLLKFFSILVMILINFFEEYAETPVMSLSETPARTILMFFSGSVSAPSFMFAMGIGLVYSKNADHPKYFVKRGIRIFLWGYLLNILRGVLPDIVMCAIRSARAGAFVPPFFRIEELLNVDILHFAGLALIFYGLCRLKKMHHFVMLIIAVLLQCLGTLIVTIPISSEVGQYIVGLLFYENSLTCFPFTLWLLYPIAGAFFGSILLHVKNKGLFYACLLPICATVLFAISVSYIRNGLDLRTIFTLHEDLTYRQDPLGVFWSLLCVIILLAVCYFLTILLKKFGCRQLLALSYFSGVHLNDIYIISWLLIGWLCVPMLSASVDGFSDPVILLWSALIIIVSFLLCIPLQKWRDRPKKA